MTIPMMSTRSRRSERRRRRRNMATKKIPTMMTAMTLTRRRIRTSTLALGTHTVGNTATVMNTVVSALLVTVAEEHQTTLEPVEMKMTTAVVDRLVRTKAVPKGASRRADMEAPRMGENPSSLEVVVVMKMTSLVVARPVLTKAIPMGVSHRADMAAAISTVKTLAVATAQTRTDASLPATEGALMDVNLALVGTEKVDTNNRHLEVIVLVLEVVPMVLVTRIVVAKVADMVTMTVMITEAMGAHVAMAMRASKCLETSGTTTMSASDAASTTNYVVRLSLWGLVSLSYTLVPEKIRGSRSRSFAPKSADLQYQIKSICSQPALH
jgi:hypothetical protein